MKYKFREYQGWSINNMKNCLHIEEGENFIVFASNKEIDEVSIFGIHKVLEHQLNIYQGLDVEAYISSGTYNKANDCISHKFKNIPYIHKASEKLEDYNKNLYDDVKGIICIYYKATPRYNKNKVWRFVNKKKSDVSSYLGDY